MPQSTPPPTVLTPPPEQPPLSVVLTCGSPECRHIFEPDPIAFAGGRLACPSCGGWTFHAELTEPTPGGDR